MVSGRLRPAVGLGLARRYGAAAPLQDFSMVTENVGNIDLAVYPHLHNSNTRHRLKERIQTRFNFDSDG
jgi:hypothetical protein